MTPAITRRQATATLIGGAAILSSDLVRAAAGCGSGNPFTLGVVSGEPRATGVVLWTRLAPRPLDPDGGMPDARVTGRWEIAEDERFATPRRGTATAASAWGHSVHIEVKGLRPGRRYFCRLHRRRRRQPDRPHPHRPRPLRSGRSPAPRLRVVSALRGRQLRRVAPCDRR